MKHITKIHFIGIGGIGMSGLARLFKHEGKEVSGSDTTETENTKKLITEGIPVTYEQTAQNITNQQESSDVPCIDLVVYTEAMASDHPELVAAREAGIRTTSYFEALGEIANEYYLIAVAGTHGKTTTTAMLIDILEEASFDPTAIVGSLRTKTGSNYRAGKSKYFIVEACEYKRDFLTLEPDVLVITNLEHEHVDYYKDLEDVQDAFHELALKVPEDGAVIAIKSDPKVAPVLRQLKARVYDYKIEVFRDIALKQPGLYNRMNAGAARATALVLGADKGIIAEALENFAGTQRRFEYKGEVNGAKVYDDYAHHPTEITATISGVRELYPDRKLTIVFQGHTYSRTHELFDDFALSLAKADRVLILPIYAAREENKSGVSAEKLSESIVEQGTQSEFFHTFDGAVVTVKESVGLDDVVVVMGAGDVTKVAALLVS
ncbi:MAG: UDP-N-acetylmuramate--alanine ligase [Acidimicrobiales bacterium]|jgi:UDP-N-acetylmuramate--alanine ligase